MRINILFTLCAFFAVISLINAISREGVTVTKDGELIELVQSEIEAAAIFSKPKALKFEHKIKSICAGGYKTVVLTEDGLVFEWGLGAGTEGKQWTPLGEDKKVISIACGDYHTLALTESGEIYSWGKDAISLGQNELKNKKRNTYIPKKVAGELEDKVVTKIFAGFLHNIAIAEDGDAYSWGDADHGQTAHPTLTTPLPKRINAPGKRFKEACCGGHHSLLLTEDGELYSVGSGSFGKLGTGSLEDTDTLNNIPLNGSKVLELACGGDHSMILLDNHDVYTWGWNEFGQLGTNDTLNRHFPTKIDFPANVSISHISVGKYAHSMAISDDNKAYLWGYNDFGQLGTGDLASRYLPTDIEAWNVTRIEGGYKHTLILRNSGELEAFGESVYGQLGEFS